jgi:hypothetical protein
MPDVAWIPEDESFFENSNIWMSQEDLDLKS